MSKESAVHGTATTPMRASGSHESAGIAQGLPARMYSNSSRVQTDSASRRVSRPLGQSTTMADDARTTPTKRNAFDGIPHGGARRRTTPSPMTSVSQRSVDMAAITERIAQMEVNFNARLTMQQSTHDAKTQALLSELSTAQRVHHHMTAEVQQAQHISFHLRNAQRHRTPMRDPHHYNTS